MRVWDVRKPFRPVISRAIVKQCRSAAWLPNGVGILGGASRSTHSTIPSFHHRHLQEDAPRTHSLTTLHPHTHTIHTGYNNGGVRLLSFPGDILRVRLYRHDAHAFDGVAQVDAAHAPALGTLVASVAMDGRARLMHADGVDLMPCRRRDQASFLYRLLALRAPTADGRAAGDTGGRLRCDVAWQSACIVHEQNEACPKGDICVPLRASLTAVRIATLPLDGLSTTITTSAAGGAAAAPPTTTEGGEGEGKKWENGAADESKRAAPQKGGLRPVVVVGSFSGLCRLVDILGVGLE